MNNFQPINAKNAFLNTAEVFPKEEDNLLRKLTALHTDVANTVNVREIALYQQNQAVLTGQQFSIPGTNQTKKYTFRQVYYFGSISAGATLTFAHGITGLVQLTLAYGTCVTASDFRPIPYASATNVTGQISLTVTATNIVIVNGSTSPNITSGIIVLEYLLNS